jgi:chromosomal replication initiator protein
MLPKGSKSNLKAWEDFLDSQERELGITTVKKWLRPLRVIRFDACNLYLEAKDSFQIHWFEEHIRPIVLTKFVSTTNKRIKVHLSLASKESKQNHSFKPKESKPKAGNSLPGFQLVFDTLDTKFTIPSFIVSKENKVTTGLLFEVASGITSLGSFNPIYIWGVSGTGKTHLLQALAQHFISSGIKALYTRAETFTEHVVSAIRSSEMQKFRLAYRNVDMLLVDDLEVFSKKGATQEELFHTFNTLHLEGKQIILSAKCAPSELQDIEARLVSRFEWGIVLPLNPINEELLRNLLLSKAKEFEISLQEGAQEFLIKTFKSNTKNLLKALDALVLRIHTGKISGTKVELPLSTQSVKELLFDLIKAEEESIVTPDKIIKVVAEYFGITVDDILGKSQSRECTQPRKIAMYLIRTELRLAFMKIGQLFGRDHSTVMTSIKYIEDEKNKKGDFSASLSLITKQLSK